MCGICGIVNYNDRKVDKKVIKKMTKAMIHRGPDDDGSVIIKNFSIGMRRLAIIDLEKGQQPISNSDNSIWVVLNGEIYNHIELRNELKKKGHIFKTKSDTEVLVHLYQEFSFEFLDRINGMFSFALIDKKNEIVWIVRDRLGIKPLYYVDTKENFIFSSDLKSIKKITDVTIDHSEILKYLGMSYIPAPKTIFREIKKLLPAHYIVIRGKKIIEKRYWDLPERTTWEGGFKRAKATLLELLNDSIKLRFRSDVPVGLFLSGGIDSSGLVALAAKLGYEDINTFTVNFLGKKGKDDFFANIVSKQYGTNHETIEFDLKNFKKELDELIPFLDEPIADSAIVPTYYLSKIARSQGIKVLLSGAGGDEIFGGYSRYFKPKIFSPRWIAENLPASLRYIFRNILHYLHPQRSTRAISPEISYALECSGADLHFFYQIIKDKKIMDDILTSMNENFLSLNDNINYSYTNIRMRIDIKNYLLDNILSLTDKSTMATSVEGRVPFLDHRLVEFCCSLPDNLNQLYSKPKGLFIESLKEDLPKELYNRKKEGFNAPTNKWIQTNVGLNIKNEILDSLHPVLGDLFNVKSLEKFLFNTNRTSGHSIYGLYVLNRWLQINNV